METERGVEIQKTRHRPPLVREALVLGERRTRTEKGSGIQMDSGWLRDLHLVLIEIPPVLWGISEGVHLQPSSASGLAVRTRWTKTGSTFSPIPKTILTPADSILGGQVVGIFCAQEGRYM